MGGILLLGVGVVIAAAFVLGLDQVSKCAVLRAGSAAGRSQPACLVRPVLSRRSLVCRFPSWVLLTCLAALALMLILLQVRVRTSAAGVGLATAFGGAASNFVDRVRRGAIVDFIAVGPWPVFNVADVGIIGGVAFAAVQVL